MLHHQNPFNTTTRNPSDDPVANLFTSQGELSLRWWDCGNENQVYSKNIKIGKKIYEWKNSALLGGLKTLNVFVLMAQYFLVCVYTQQHVDVCIQNDRHRIQIFSGRRALIFFCGLRWFSPPMNSAIAYRELQPMAAHTQTFACLYIHTERERVATVMRGHTGPPTSARSRRSNTVILFVSYIMRRSPAVGWVIEKKRDVLI